MASFFNPTMTTLPRQAPTTTMTRARDLTEVDTAAMSDIAIFLTNHETSYIHPN